jgi:hypothetical protein
VHHFANGVLLHISQKQDYWRKDLVTFDLAGILPSAWQSIAVDESVATKLWTRKTVSRRRKVVAVVVAVAADVAVAEFVAGFPSLAAVVVADSDLSWNSLANTQRDPDRTKLDPPS